MTSDDYKRLADRLELFWRILNTARKSDSPTVSVWASDTDLIAEAANVLRAASVKAGEVVAVKPLRWNRTTIWGEFKWRAICPAFGHEYACFMQGDLTLPEQQERKDKIQEEYERGIRSALVVEPVKGEPVAWRYRDPNRIAGSCWSYDNAEPDQILGREIQPLYTAPTASVGAMREALEQALERMKTAVDWWNKGGHSLPQMSAAIEMAESALAENQPDGDVEESK